MPRRVILPAPEGASPTAPHASPGATPDAAVERDAGEDPGAERRPSGRVRHDEKVTVYLTSQELVELEQARLTLRGTHGYAVDRGRLVREAVSLVLGDLAAEGEHSALVRRLAEE